MAQTPNTTSTPIVDPSTMQQPLQTIPTNDEIKLYSIPNQNPVLLNLPNEQQMVDLINSYTTNNNQSFVTNVQNIIDANSLGGSPGGSDKEIQYNNAGVFGGDPNFTWNGSTKVLTVGGGASIKPLAVGESLVVSTVVSSSAAAGSLTLTAGDSGGSFTGGSVSIQAGLSGDISGNGSHDGGTVTIQSGSTGSNNQAGSGGNIAILAANSGYSNVGGSGATAKGGSVTIKAGNGGTGPTISGNVNTGGSLSLTAGNAGGDANGGDVSFTPGTGNGTGHDGDTKINGASAISTSATGKFFVIPMCAGTPTGTPANNGSVVYDTTNNKLYVYNGSWKSVTLT